MLPLTSPLSPCFSILWPCHAQAYLNSFNYCSLKSLHNLSLTCPHTAIPPWPLCIKQQSLPPQHHLVFLSSFLPYIVSYLTCYIFSLYIEPISYKLTGDISFFYFSIVFPQLLEQCLPQIRCSTNIYRMNKWRVNSEISRRSG